ncbi:hypothetical protein BH23ACT6_BH23ACT6_06610 [soil metagenome]
MLTLRRLSLPSVLVLTDLDRWRWLRTSVNAFRCHFRRVIGTIESTYSGPSHGALARDPDPRNPRV